MGIKTINLPVIGKYRDIVIAASLFVIFDLFVLILNFYTSFEIAKDATSINLSGRQRMLSQRMTKTLLQIETAQDQEQKLKAVSELSMTAGLFGDTFDAFRVGGQTRNTDNTGIELTAIEDSEAQSVLNSAEHIWVPLKQYIQNVVESPDNEAVLKLALAHANKNNLALLKLMNDLTTRLAGLAQDKAEQLRMFQSVGITLATINFALLLFHFLRKLNRSDAAAEEAKQETEEILTTVNDGFFLVDEDLNLGHKYSSAMKKMFRRDIVPGTPFLSLLEGKVFQQTLDTAREYIQLLFTQRIRENLTADLNPLIRLEIDLSDDAQKQDIHYLNIVFKRVRSEKGISHLLGSVSDITEQVKLERSLEISEARSKEELKLLSQLLQTNPKEMKEYVETLNRLLLSMNGMLEKSHSANDYSHIINQSLPAVHKLKGDASAMGSDIFASMTHELEMALKALETLPVIESREMLPITVQINNMLAKIATVEQIIDKIARLIPAFEKSMTQSTSVKWQQDLEQLAERAANDLDKQVMLRFTQSNLDHVSDESAGRLRDICVQMVRNAVAHGIEKSDERIKMNKSEIGEINVSLVAASDKTELVIRDDGQGLSLEKIRNSLLKKNVYTQEQLNEMDHKSIIMSIFRGGISTAEELTEHAGQGIGLSVVKQAMNELGGQIMIGSRRGQYTEFRFVFTNVAVQDVAGVIAA